MHELHKQYIFLVPKRCRHNLLTIECKVICSDRYSSLIPFIMHISLNTFNLSTLFTHNTITYKIFFIHLTYYAMDVCYAMSFCLLKTNNLF